MIQQLALNVSVDHECYPQLAQYDIGVSPHRKSIAKLPIYPHWQSKPRPMASMILTA